MNTQQNFPQQPPQESSVSKFNNWLRNSVTIRLLSITILVLLLLIPTSMIESMIEERQWTHDEVLTEISSKWGLQQTVSGPMISVPYNKYYKDEDDKLIKTTDYLHFLPNDLNIEGGIEPKKKKRGIYEVVIYNTELNINGSFPPLDANDWDIRAEDVRWKDAFLSVGVSDMGGIKESVNVQWNDEIIALNPGIESNQVLYSGISARIPLVNGTDSMQNSGYNFSFKLNLNGSRELMFAPLGRETKIALNSTWADPKFDGFRLPEKSDVSEKGFTADWKVLHLNRNYPQKWVGDAHRINESIVGVTLLLPVDHYLKSMRSAKYAIMIISLTFLTFFFIEILNKKRIHPIQYILVGLALCIFYTLLLAFSEHIGFNNAYLVSGFMVITLIAVYAQGMFKSIRLTVFLTGILFTLFGFVFTILQLQDYALLMGSIGLFLVLAIVMFLSRKINWYNLTQKKE